MAVILDDESFNRLVTMHHYAEAAMALAHSSPYGTVGALRTDEKQDEALMHFNVLISGRVCASEEGADPRDGIERIADERMRQLNELGWTEQHDDEHHKGELAYAATCYATPPWTREVDFIEDTWPWEVDGHGPDATPFKFSEREQPEHVETRRRELTIAGAMIAAELDRLDRLAARIEAD